MPLPYKTPSIELICHNFTPDKKKFLSRMAQIDEYHECFVIFKHWRHLFIRTIRDF